MNEQQFNNRSVLDGGQLTDVRRSNVTLHFEDVEREDLWRTILQSSLISLSIDNELY
jgi:hypothetical protein